MDFDLSADQMQIREAVRGLVRKYDLDYWLEKDRAHAFPTELWSDLGRHGWLGIAIPEEYGGAGLGLQELVLVVEESCRAGGGSTVAQLFMLTPIFGGVSITQHGTAEQKRRFLPGLASGEVDFCMALTEPDAGSNALKIRTEAVRTDDGWRISGQKIWTSAVDQADWMLLVARTTPIDKAPRRTMGLTLFIVPASHPSITIRPIEKLGTHCVGSFTVFIDDLVVPADAVLGEVDQGWRHLLATLNTERMVTAAGCIATGDLSLDIAAGYARERAVFSAPIGSHQAIQFPLARVKIELELARLANYRAAWLYDRGRECGAEANMAKYAAARAGLEAADRAIQTLGGMGYARESHVERLWRDVRLFGIAPVSEELTLAHIGQAVLELPRSY